MQVNVSNIVFNFSTTTPGQVASANFTFYGSDPSTGEFLNNTVRVDKTELPDGTTFFTGLDKAQTIARQKLLKYLALPTDTTTTTA
ncbi:hypothetical protein [Limosilactobacillus fermentum]|mgnify:FL=1|jgi:hypothetical protein|uniref:hypothetical protein n=1 Tax=Limosilactobacillus fermentum TaxID=1613 RepID=UPI000C1E4BAA|nr:hypothetical protein [Limosilactobacillus fermentum]PJE93456.1 hypothetical protein CU094_00990 [Limosilactobacillus fermentum]UTF48266.1 hypothetical protein NHN16_03880 [Limosilactobacillus fermentum]UZM85816.1 hypothetical protein OP867_02720 [Limosilactobacillus fermentum]